MKRACAPPCKFFREHNIRAVGVCLMHSYANAAHERRVAEIFAEEYPECALSLSCDVLPEYREYERAVTTLVDAFVKPHMERYLRRVHDELGDLKDKPFLVMQSSGGVASAAEVVRKPITTALSGPGGRRARQRGDFRDGRLPEHRHARCRRHLDRPLPDRRRQAARHQRRRGRLVPGAHPDDRHRDDRHRRRLDRLDHPRRPSQGRPEKRGRRARPDVLPERRQRADHHRRQSGARPHSGGADRRRHRARRRALARRHRGARRAAARQHERRAARPRHHRDRQLEPGQRDPADDHPARHRSARLCAAVVRRRRPGAVAGGDGPAQHAGLHRAAQPRQPLGLRPAGGRLAHRPDRHQGHAPGQRRPRRGRRHLCQAGAARRSRR